MQKGNLKAHIDARQFVVLIQFSFPLLMSLSVPVDLNTLARIVVMPSAMPRRESDTGRVFTDTNRTTPKDTLPETHSMGRRKESPKVLERLSRTRPVDREPQGLHHIAFHTLRRRTLRHPNFSKLLITIISGKRLLTRRALTPKIRSTPKKFK